MDEPVKRVPGAMGHHGGRFLPAGLAIGLVVIHIVISWAYGSLLPWGGDEWYTYDGRTLMAVPNTVLIEIARVVIGDVAPENFMWYRFTGVVWTSLAIAGLFLLGWSDKKYAFFVPVAIFLVFSPFVFYQEQYFRYYGYYLGASFGVFLMITSLDAEYRRYRFLFWGLLVLSPFIYLFIGLQVGCYIAFREWTCLQRRGRVVVGIGGLVAAVLVSFLWGWLIRTGMEVAFSGMSAMADATHLRGFSPGLAVKPFYFVFESLWGYHVEPTENGWVMGLVFWVFVFLAARFISTTIAEPGRGLLMAVCFLLPLALIYLVLEPFTPPGATQLESKHALFGLPWLLLIGFGSRRSWVNRVGVVTLFLVLAVSLHFTFRRSAPAWPVLVERAVEVVDSGGRIILDGRSDRTFRFYAGGQIVADSIISIGNQEAIQSLALDEGAKLMVIHNDWKAYQLLNLKQNWNSGSTSAAKVEAVSTVEGFLRGGNFHGIWGLVRFPLHAFTYGAEGRIAAPIPSVLPIEYRDLEFPRTLDGRRLIGAARIRKGASVVVDWGEGGRTPFFWFLKGGARLAPGTEIGKLDVSGKVMQIKAGMEAGSAYEANFCRAIEGSALIDVWRKRPLISQASRYPGSFFSAEGKIYTHVVETGYPVTVEVTHADVELVILVPAPATLF